MNIPLLSKVPCPCCNSSEVSFWAEENGFKVVRCLDCDFLYVNPRPPPSCIDSAVRNGEHEFAGLRLNVRSRRIPRKVTHYQRFLSKFYGDLWESSSQITWVDVGAGYGETLEAIGKLAPFGSTIIGVEPMLHKAEIAKSRGLNIFNGYLQRGQFRADVISAVDIFSHIPDFRSFLQIVASNLTKGGEVFIETGNLASLNLREEFPGELGLPDHLTFAAEEHLIRFLNDVGFDVIKVSYERVDGIQSFVKNILKKIIGRPVVFGIPYKSKYRQIRIRAKLRNSEV